MATSKIYGANVLPRYIENFTNKLQQVIHDVSKWITGNGIKTQLEQRYAFRLI